MSVCVAKLAHVLHIEQLHDVKETASVLELETRQRFKDYICSFVVVRDTFEGFEVMAHKRFDCVVIDEKVQFNAYETAQIIRTLMPSIPILMILHSTVPDLKVEESAAAGCTHLLTSNFTNDDYCTALRNMLAVKENVDVDHNITCFPWNDHIPSMQELANLQRSSHYSPSNESNFQLSALLPPSLPASLMQHPSMSSDLLSNARQFFEAQRCADAGPKQYELAEKETLEKLEQDDESKSGSWSRNGGSDATHSRTIHGEDIELDVQFNEAMVVEDDVTSSAEV